MSSAESSSQVRRGIFEPTVHAAAIATSDHETDKAQCDLRDSLQNPPQPTNEFAAGIVAWAVSTFYLVITFLEAIFKEHQDRFTELEGDITALQDHQTTVPSTTSKPSTSAATRTPRKPRSCTTCHAHGHITSECRTANPAATRKQIASNRRKEKATSQPLPPYLYYPTTVIPPPSSAGPHHLAAATPVDFANFAADAQEFRRRHQQLIRDKRRARRSINPT